MTANAAIEHWADRNGEVLVEMLVDHPDIVVAQTQSGLLVISDPDRLVTYDLTYRCAYGECPCDGEHR